MLLNYLKIAARSFGRQKYYSLINTVGLALGIAACILILLFVKDELSYEAGFDNHKQIYRLTEDFPMVGIASSMGRRDQRFTGLRFVRGTKRDGQPFEFLGTQGFQIQRGIFGAGGLTHGRLPSSKKS